jgi:hypothetical protein
MTSQLIQNPQINKIHQDIRLQSLFSIPDRFIKTLDKYFIEVDDLIIAVYVNISNNRFIKFKKRQ